MLGDKATIDNVKIVFFDVLAKQVSSLIDLKDKLTNATDEQFDMLSNEFESQFGLLRDTINNVLKLMDNVKMFDNGEKNFIANMGISNAATSDIVAGENSYSNNDNESKEIDSPLKIENESTADDASSENKFILENTSEEEKSVEQVDVSPLIPVSPSFEKASEELIKNYNLSNDDVSSSDKEETKEEDKEEKPVALVPENILSDIQKSDDVVQIDSDNSMEEEKDLDGIDDEDMDDEVEEKPTLVNLPSVENNKTESTETNQKVSFDKCIKISDKQTKAIVVNVQQLEKLRASREKEMSKLDFGIDINSESTNSANADAGEMEKLLQQANDLYKQGRAIEAEQIYQRIRELNKK